MAADHYWRAFRGWLAGCGAAAPVFGGGGLIGSMVASGIDIITLVGGPIAVPFLLFPIFSPYLPRYGNSRSSRHMRQRDAWNTLEAVLWRQWGRDRRFNPKSVLGVSSAMRLGAGWLFLSGGFAAGMAYWHVAGRYAGGDRLLPNNGA